MRHAEEERSAFTGGNIWSVQTLSNADLIVSGSINQADRRFSDVSRGKQCAFTSLLTLLRANSCRVSQWTADTVDEILIHVLIEEDTMYVPIRKYLHFC